MHRLKRAQRNRKRIPGIHKILLEFAYKVKHLSLNAKLTFTSWTEVDSWIGAVVSISKFIVRRCPDQMMDP